MAKARGACSDCGRVRLIKRGFCGACYERRRKADPAFTSPPPVDLAERFFGKVRQSGECWEWTASTNGVGYGKFNDARRTVYAHRWAWAYFVADIPEGLDLDHLCRNRACVNPWHLEPVTRLVNLQRGQTVIAAQNRNGYCRNGHLIAGENRAPDGRCLICRRAAHRRQYHARKAAA